MIVLQILLEIIVETHRFLISQIELYQSPQLFQPNGTASNAWGGAITALALHTLQVHAPIFKETQKDSFSI